MRTKDQIQLENLYLSIHQKQFLKEGETWDTIKSVGHVALDLAGLIPIVGEVADASNAVWYALEGEYLYAALSLISCLPGLGDAIGKGGKLAVWMSKAGKAGAAVEKGIVKAGPYVSKVKTLIQANEDNINKLLEAGRKNEKLAPHVDKMKEALNVFTGKGSAQRPGPTVVTKAPPVPGSVQATAAA